MHLTAARRGVSTRSEAPAHATDVVPIGKELYNARGSLLFGVAVFESVVEGDEAGSVVVDLADVAANHSEDC